MEEWGVSVGTAAVGLLILYFVVKAAVHSAIADSKNEIAKAVKKGMEKYEAEKGSPAGEEGEG